MRVPIEAEAARRAGKTDIRQPALASAIPMTT